MSAAEVWHVEYSTADQIRWDGERVVEHQRRIDAERSRAAQPKRRNTKKVRQP